MRFHRILLYLFLLSFGIGCYPDPDSPIDIGSTPPPPPPNISTITVSRPFYAGIVSFGMVQQQFIPPLQLPITYDSTGIFGIGSAQIDMDLNGSNDLFFQIHIIHPDSFYSIPGLPIEYPTMDANCANGFSVNIYRESYYAGQQTYAHYDLAQNHPYHKRIDTLSKWEADLDIWSKNPGWGTMPLAIGNWYFATGVNYLAIHRQGRQYGWVAMDITNKNFPKILSCAYYPNL